MTSLVEKIVELHRRFDRARVPHAFGGALALAWCTQQARATSDIVVNVFVSVDEVDRVLGALPEDVRWTDDDERLLHRDGQARLWWDTTPIDVFFDTTDFHRRAAGRCRVEPFGGAEVPFLGCDDLAVFKAFFDRTKDWADLEAMADAGTLDVDRVVGALVSHLGADDQRVGRLRGLF
jgi:hypothetical protein